MPKSLIGLVQMRRGGTHVSESSSLLRPVDPAPWIFAFSEFYLDTPWMILKYLMGS